MSQDQIASGVIADFARELIDVSVAQHVLVGESSGRADVQETSGISESHSFTTPGVDRAYEVLVERFVETLRREREQHALEEGTASQERDVLDSLVRRHQRSLLQVARQYGLDPAEAEDVVQTAWLRFIQRPSDSPIAPDGVRGFLHKCVRDEALRLLQGGGRVRPEGPSPGSGDELSVPSALDEAVAREHTAELSQLFFTLGARLQAQRRLAEARVAYELAMKSGATEHATTAAFNLGDLLREQGEVEGAKAAYQQAIDSGSADQAPRAALSLASLLLDHSDVRGARAAYQTAIDSGHPDVALRAEINLRRLRERRHDLAGAELRLRVTGYADSYPDEWAELASRLEQELRDLEVVTVSHPHADSRIGAKGRAQEWAHLVVTSTSGLPPILATLQSWLGRNPQFSITLEIDSDRVTLSGYTAGERSELIAAWMARHGRVEDP